MGFAQRYAQLQQQVAEIAAQAGRSVDDICIVGVSKTVGIAQVQEAQAAGAKHFGENRPDELMKKADALPDSTWHFIGNIQSRRIGDIVRYAALIHSVCKREHIAKINVSAQRRNKVQDILLEVNVSGEASKSGFSVEEAKEAALQCAEFPFIRLRGLMTMAPQGDVALARATFEGLSLLHSDIRLSLGAAQASLFDELSMGMSEDWQEAIRAGATIIRVGRALFSDEFDQGR